MSTRLRRLLLLGALLGALSCGGSKPPTGPDDIKVRLAAIPGLTVSEQSAPIEGYRFFVMAYDQPADHLDPGGARFQQRLTLLHRDASAPMVLYNSGYFVSLSGGRTELTRLIQGNQLAVEHRFFGPSRPEPADWRDLTIEQAAADHHRIIAAFRTIYGARWLATGGSKGGLTAVFHRRFYPNDVDGVVAYVAPLTFASDAEPTVDNRYILFVDQAGSDEACRQSLRDFQRLVLGRTEEMFPMMDALAMDQETSFEGLLGKRRALEFSVEETPFLFWQYGSATACPSIPKEGASAETVFQFLDDTAELVLYSNAGLAAFLPYFHQAATELGYPAVREDHLLDLLQYPHQDVPTTFIPEGVLTPPYQPEAMVDIQSWVETSGERLLFIYGENDPWSAGAFDLGAAKDSFRFTVPSGNHGSRIAHLHADDLATALDAISRWSGVQATLSNAKPLLRPSGERERDPLDLRPAQVWREELAGTRRR